MVRLRFSSHVKCSIVLLKLLIVSSDSQEWILTVKQRCDCNAHMLFFFMKSCLELKLICLVRSQTGQTPLLRLVCRPASMPTIRLLLERGARTEVSTKVRSWCLILFHIFEIEIKVSIHFSIVGLMSFYFRWANASIWSWQTEISQ